MLIIYHKNVKGENQMERQGYGKGKGMGYKNLVIKDPYIHSLNAKGVKSKVKRPKAKKSKTPQLDMMKERTDLVSVLRGKGFRKDFGLIPTPQKKGLIKELARKVVEGVGYALEWEKEHLPSQANWVKDEFVKAKDEAVKLAKTGIAWEKEHFPAQKQFIQEKVTALEKAGAEKIQELKQDLKQHKELKELGKVGITPYYDPDLKLKKAQDLHDVRDELDLNDDGVQDIPMYELEKANSNIVSGLNKIDLNQNNIPDHQEDGFTNLSTMKLPPQPSYTEPSEYMSNVPVAPIPFMAGEPEPLPEIPFEPLEVSEVEYEEKMGIPFPMMTGADIKPKKSFFQKAGEFAKKEYDVGKGYVQERQRQVKEIHQIPDNKLKQYAIEEGEGFMGGLNKYEKEIIRREKERKFLAEKLKQVARGEDVGSGIGNILGFMNPLGTLKPKPKDQKEDTSGDSVLSFMNPLSAFKPSLSSVPKRKRYYYKNLKPKIQSLNEGFNPFGFLNPIAELKTVKKW